MKKFIVISILLLFCLLTFKLTVFSKNNTVNIEVTNTVIKKIIPDMDFVGVNWPDDNPVFRRLFSSKKNIYELGKTLNQNNIKTIRYPGGHNVLTFFWDVPIENINAALIKIPPKERSLVYRKKLRNSDKLQFADFLKFCKQHNLNAVIQVNTQWIFDKANNEMLPLKEYERNKENHKIWKTGKINWERVDKAAKYAARQVAWTKQHGYFDLIKYWELGNEEYNKYNLGAGYTGEEYARVAAKFIDAMTKTDPDIKFVLTNEVIKPKQGVYSKYYKRNDWTKAVLSSPVLKKYRDKIAAVSNHSYPTGKTSKDKSEDAFIDHVYNYNFSDFAKTIQYHQSILKEANFPEKDIFINEFNTHSFNNPNAHTWMAAIANANLIMTCANTPACAHMDYHNLLHYYGCYKGTNENKGFGMIHFAPDFTFPFILYPDANAIGLLNTYLKGSVLKIAVNSPDNLFYAVATVYKNFIYLIILNKKTERIANLNLSGFSDIKYSGGKVLGMYVPLDFTPIKKGDSCVSPSEIKILNVLDYNLDTKESQNNYKLLLPKNTLSVFIFILK